MIQIVPTGDLGLDLLLGGGWRLVARLPERASATVVVRGGPGAGKTLVGIHTALALAEALGGDVVVACVEILPSEYVAQLRSAREDIDDDRVVALPGSVASKTVPRIFCGLLTDLDPAAPDLVASLESLGRDVVAVGGKPAVFIVDSLIEGYGIGTSAPRTSADAVMKFAAEGGYGLVLCEEARDDLPSPWVFAVDTVLELGVEPRERGRWLEVKKHRYGASVSGRHELDLRGWFGGFHSPAVYPEPHAWAVGHVRSVLKADGWEFREGHATPALAFAQGDNPPSKPHAIDGAFVLVTSPDAGFARILSAGLLPRRPDDRSDLVMEFDPLVLHAERSSSDEVDVYYVPTVHGPARALRELIDRFRQVFPRGERRARARRVLVGDLGLVLDTPEALAWVEAVRVFASLVIAAGWGVPVIAHATVARGPSGEASARSILGTYPDVHVDMNGFMAQIRERWHARQRDEHFPRLTDAKGVPQALLQLPRPRGRDTVFRVGGKRK